MPLSVFAFVLFAAALHAAWNAVVKRGSDKLLTTVLVALASVIWIGAPLSPMAWLGLSVICAGVLSMAAGARRSAAAGFKAAHSHLVTSAYPLLALLSQYRHSPPQPVFSLLY